MRVKGKRIASLLLILSLALSGLSVSTMAEMATTTDLPTVTPIVEDVATDDEPTLPENEPTEVPTGTQDEEPAETETEPVDPDVTPEPEVPEVSPAPGEGEPTPLPEESASPDTTEQPADEPTEEKSPTQAAIDANGYAYVTAECLTKVYSTMERTEDSLIYTTADDYFVLLATAYYENGSVQVSFLDAGGSLISGYIAETDLWADLLPEEYLASILETLAVPDIPTVIGLMNLFLVEGVKPTAEPVETVEPDPIQYAAVGDYVSVTTRTRVFSQVDDQAVAEYYSNAFIGFFVSDAVVQVTEVTQDSAGNAWYQVRYLYGADASDGSMKWTDFDTIYVLAAEAEATDSTECTVTDYAYSREFLQMLQQTDPMFTTTSMNGFSLKNISVNLGGFYALSLPELPYSPLCHA